MAERYGYKTIKDAIVTLLGTTKVSDLNNGLARAVQQVITTKPTDVNAVIPSTKFPTVCIWLQRVEETYRGASKRKESIASYEIHFWTYSIGSVDKALDEAQLLADNILYIINGNIDIANVGSTKGYLKGVSVTFDYNTNDSGFIAHGFIDLQVFRYLD
jgi:hypothetical protein